MPHLGGVWRGSAGTSRQCHEPPRCAVVRRYTGGGPRMTGWKPVGQISSGRRWPTLAHLSAFTPNSGEPMQRRGRVLGSLVAMLTVATIAVGVTPSEAVANVR